MVSGAWFEGAGQGRDGAPAGSNRLGHEAMGFDHGVGHPLLLLYDAKTPRGQKTKEFNGLGDDPFNVSISLF